MNPKNKKGHLKLRESNLKMGKISEHIPHQRRYTDDIQKDAQHDISLGNCKLKQWTITACLIEWTKSKTLTMPNTGEDVKQEKLSFILGRNAKRCSHYER